MLRLRARVGDDVALDLLADETELDGRAFFELFDPASRDRVRLEALPAVQVQGTWSGEATLVGPGITTPTSLVLVAHREHRLLERAALVLRQLVPLAHADALPVERPQRDSALGTLIGGVRCFARTLTRVIFWASTPLMPPQRGTQKVAKVLAL